MDNNNQVYINKLKYFWISSLKRAIHTMAQAAIACIGAGVVGIAEVDWIHVGSVSLMAGIVSMLKSIVIGTPEAKIFEGIEEDEVR